MAVADSIDRIPSWEAFDIGRAGLAPPILEIEVDAARIDHHGNDVFKEMGGMRVVFRVAVLVVLKVELGIGLWVEERGSLSRKREKVEESFPEGAHGEHSMSHVAVQEEALGEYARVPVGDEETDDYQHAGGVPFIELARPRLDSFREQIV